MKNLLGIESAGELAVAEADCAAACTLGLREGCVPAGTWETSDLAHLKAIQESGSPFGRMLASPFPR